MYDLLPFPNVLTKTSEEQIGELVNYLIQFKEALEFILTNISVENLSPELTAKIQSLGTSEAGRDMSEELAQIASRSLTISDVVNSKLFEKSVKDISADIEFTINFETGNLEYN